MDETYTAKDFIQKVWINEMKDVVNKHAFLSFALIPIGIEFLGKCRLEELDHWDLNTQEMHKYKPFDKGLELMIEVDGRYKGLDLKNQLRNGFAHTLLPKSKISLSEVKAGDIHFAKDKKDRTILVIEILYRDFVIACKKILTTNFDKDNKINKPFLSISNN